jgi:uncharacterized protein YjgD (DUF1641 family)
MSEIKYSEAEQNLIKKLIPEDLSFIILAIDTDHNNSYVAMALDCFIKNEQGPNINTLRKIIEALSNDEIKRGTPEFDALCEIKEEQEQDLDNVMGSIYLQTR